MNYRIFKGEEAVRPKSIDNPCEGKKKYRLREARQTVNTLHRMGRFKQGRIYQCDDHWHIARARDS